MNLQIVRAGTAIHNVAVVNQSDSPVLVWTMKSDGGDARCVVNLVPLGFEMQYVLNGSLLISQRFDRLDEVVDWAARKQLALQQRGWVRA